MGIVNAARAAGYSESYSTKKAYRIEHMAKVGLADAFERAGLTDKKIIEHALAGLEATKELIVDGERYGDTPEWQVRHKYFMSILQLTKRISTAEDRPSGETRIIIVRADSQQIPTIDKGASPENRIVEVSRPLSV